MSSGPISNYAIDLVFVIDITGSMGKVIEEVKKLVVGFIDQLREAMANKGKGLQDLQVRVITFRDLGVEGRGAITASSFFELPHQAVELRDFVARLAPAGGGTEPESGREALWTAMRSPWRNVLRSRHVVVMLTDASAHPLGMFEYPSDLFQDAVPPPASLNELKKQWGVGTKSGVMNSQARRLVLFAPTATPWNEIGEHWENVTWLPSEAGSGCDKADLEVILGQIAQSV